MKRLLLAISLLCALSIQAQTYWDGTADKNLPGEGTKASPYLISTPEQLAGLAERTNVDKEDFVGKYIKLTADIYLTDFTDPDTASWKEWEPIAHSLMKWGEDIDEGFFRGHFDGGGHTIYNMYYGKGMNWADDWDPDDWDIDLGDYDYSVMHRALFVNLDGGTIENLTLRNAKMSAVGQALLVFNASEGSVIRNCHVQGEFRATSGGSSGLVGTNSGLIESCSANIHSDLQQCAGLVGTNEAAGVIRNCSTGGFIRCTKGDGSGFVNTNRGLIEGCLANVKILALGGKDDNVNHTFRYRNGSSFVHENAGIIRECGATGDLDAEGSSINYVWRSAISGFVYRNWESFDRAGRIESCYATGNLRDVSDSTKVGGNPEFATFCYDNGEDAQHVTDPACRGDIINCYSTGSIKHHDANYYKTSIHAFLASKHTVDGGFDADLLEPSVQFACFFNSDGLPAISDKAETGWDGIAKPLAEMKSQAFVDTLNMVASLLGSSQWELRDGLPRPTGTRIKNSTVLFGGGSGAKDDPYLIATREHIDNLRWLVKYGHDFRSEYFLQTADIALNAPREQWEYEAPKRWEPIGMPYAYEFYSREAPRMFRGIYDGGFHEVQNMYISSIPSGNYGLFSTMGKGTQLRNLGATDAYIRADGKVGILVGSAGKKAVISQCWTSGDVSWKTQYGATVGGIAGSGGDGCLFLNCSSSATVTGGIGGNTIQPYSGAAKGNYNVYANDSLVNFLFTGNLSVGERGLYGAGFEYFANMFVDKEKAKINYQSDGRYGTTMPTAWMQSKELVNIYNYSVSQWNATHSEDLQLNYWEWHEGAYPRVSNNKSWRPDVRITFNSNGGETIVDKYVYSGSEALPPQRPLRDGYIFAGWYKDPGLTQFFCWEAERPTSNLTLYARWHKDDRFEIDITPFQNEFATKIHIKTAAQLRGFAAIVNGVYDWGEKVPYSSEDPQLANPRYPVSTIIVPDGLEGKSVVLDNDILLCDTTDWQYWGRGAFGLPWKAIGSATGVNNEGRPSFKGTFDGQGHVIYGMYIELNGMPGWSDSDGRPAVGLFGTVSNATAIQNVGVAASVIDGQNYNTRGQAGDAVWYWRRQGYGSQGWYYVGMLAGKVSGGTTVSQCFTQGNMYMETSYGTAGFAGSAGNISNCYSRVNIHVNNYKESYVPQDYGFVAENSSITNSYCAGQSYHAFCGGSNITGCYYDKTHVKVPGSQATPATPNAMRAKATFDGWDFENVWGSNDAINDGYPYLRIFKEGVPDDPDPVLVTGITLNVSDTTIIAGNTLQLIATIVPEDAENKKVIWSSKNNYISDKWFSIDENGLVTTKVDLETNGGSAQYVIAATTDEGNYEATCTLTVVQPRIADIRPIAYRRIGDTEWKYKEYLSIASENFEYMVVAYTDPDEGNDGISWKTSDPDRLSIEEMTDTVCTFYFYGYGERTYNCGRALVRCHKAIEGDDCIKIEASLTSGINRVYDAYVRVVECTRIKGIYKYPLQLWSEWPDTEMNVGAQQLLTVELDDDISYLPTIKWTSSDPTVLSVDENGLVTAVSPGTATITASVPNTDVSLSTETITVKEIEVWDVTIKEYNGERIELDEGDTYQLTAVINPDNATYKTITWTSSNDEFATVDENGLVRAVKGDPNGNDVTITASSNNGRKADAHFKIKKDILPEKIVLSKHELTLKAGQSNRLSITILPDNATLKTVSWISSDSTVATISDIFAWGSAQVNALKVGTAEIIARVGKEGHYICDTCQVTVVPDKVTVSFYNWDGTLLQQSEVEYGEMPRYSGITPSRESTAQYDYVFAGWDPEIVKAEADASYTATYEEKERKYTVSFYDWDGSLLQELEVEYGKVPEYVGFKPTRESTAQYDYEFIGWSPELAKVESDASYTATYSETLRKYTVSFYDWDGSLLQESDVEYGKVPEYTGSAPTRESTAQYDFEFIGWSPEIAKVEAEATYTATYKETLRKYSISFYDWDGSLLQESEVEYGKVPEYTGSAPTRESTVRYNYTFAGWSPKIAKVNADASYTATYTENVRKYTILFNDWDGSLLQKYELEYGSIPKYNGAMPTKESTEQFEYAFAGWSPKIVKVEANATYTATYTESIRKYTISFYDWDGSLLQQTEMEYGSVPKYDGPEPTRESTSEDYDYIFKGWSPIITFVTGDADYVAEYEEVESETGLLYINGVRITHAVKYLDKKGRVFILLPDGRKYYLYGKEVR